MVDSLSARASVAAATGARARAPVNVDGREHKFTAGRLCQAAVAARMVTSIRSRKCVANKKMQGREVSAGVRRLRRMDLRSTGSCVRREQNRE